MRGVLAIVKLMFTAWRVQRWCLGAGALLALAGAAGMVAGSRSWWAPVAAISSCLFLLPLTPFMGGALLRHLAAARAVRLIPRARLQLLLGGLLAQLLAASVAAIVITAAAAYLHLHRHPSAAALTFRGLFAAVFVSAFALITFIFFTVYYGGRQRGAFIFVLFAISPEVLSVVFPHWSLDELLTSARALSLAFVGTSSLWALFATVYLRAGRIAPALWDLGGSATGPAPLMHWLAARDGRTVIDGSGRNATRVLLTGRYFGRPSTRSLVVIGTGILCGYSLWRLRSNPVLNRDTERFLAVFIAYMGGVAAAASIQPMLGRARYLWLKARLDRSQLFGAVEGQSWRTLLSVAAFTLAMTAYICHLAQVPWVVITQILLLSFVCAMAMIYLVLLSTRGMRLMELLLATVLSALWFFGLLESVFAAGGSRLTLLLLPELLLIPLLRLWARSRWTRIDWMINRPLQPRRQPAG